MIDGGQTDRVLINTAEAAALLGVGYTKFYELIPHLKKAGVRPRKLPGVRRRRWLRDELAEWANELPEHKG